MRSATLGLFMFCATSAVADERTDTVTRCVSAFAAGDTAAHAAAAAAVRAWGEIQDANLRQAAMACLSLSPASPPPASQESTTAANGSVTETIASTNGTIPEQAVSTNADRSGATSSEAPQLIETTQEADASQGAETSKQLDSYLSRLDANPRTILEIVHEIGNDPHFVPEAGARRDRLESALLEYVRPLPARNAAENFRGYLALARIAPEKTIYAQKAEHYDAVLEGRTQVDEQRQKSVIKKLVKKTAEFDGSAWYRHPSSPKYQDIRPYVTLYISESGSGRRYLELFVNYTSRTDWLFVESAQINVDGRIVRLPPSEWLRDNDTEIWEWTRYVNDPDMIRLARQIAESDRAVIRFNGQQFYSDHVITSTEKAVIQDMLLAWEAMKK